MSCADFSISPAGRTGIGVIQPQSGLDYPLVQPSADIRYLIADFYFAYNDPADYTQTNSTPAQPPFRIKRLYNVGCIDNPVPTDHVPRGGSAIDIVIVDANDAVIFDTTTAVLTEESVSAWGGDYNLYIWKTADAVCRMLIYTTWAAADDDKKNYDKYLAPQNAVLDSRSVYRMPKHVKSLSIRNGTFQTQAYRGDFVFQNGYNTEIAAVDPATTAFRRTTRIAFSAVSGSGAGKYPCATGSPTIEYPIKTINGVPTGAGGHFLLGAADCLWIRRPTIYIPGTANPRPTQTVQQQIGADCKPCCSCADYAATALFMNYTRDRYKLIGQRATEIKGQHETNIARWTAYRQCTISNPLKVVIVPQRAPFADIAIMVCNNCDTCLPPSSLRLELIVLNVVATDTTPTVNFDAIDAEVVCGYTEVYFPGINAKSTAISKPARLTYLMSFPQLKQGDSGYIKFRLEFSPRVGMEIRAQVTGTTGANTPIYLNCGEEPLVAAIAETRDTLLNFNVSGKASRTC